MKYEGIYSSNLTKVCKAAASKNRLIVSTGDDGKSVYVSDGFILARLSPYDYEALVRPVTMCDAGNFAISKGEKQASDTDIAKLLKQNADACTCDTERGVATFNTNRGDKTATLVPFRNSNGDYIVAAEHLTDMFIPGTGLTYKSKNTALSPIVYYLQDNPFLVVMPIRPDAMTDRICAAIFDRNPSDELTAKLQKQNADLTAKLQKQNADLTAKLKDAERARDKYAQEAHAARSGKAAPAPTDAEQRLADMADALDESNAKIAALTAALEEAKKQNAELTAALEQAPTQHTEQASEATPAADAEGIARTLQNIDGIAVTIKGISTSAPVVWIEGSTEGKEDELKNAGAQWSKKRGQFYVRVK